MILQKEFQVGRWYFVTFEWEEGRPLHLGIPWNKSQTYPGFARTAIEWKVSIASFGNVWFSKTGSLQNGKSSQKKKTEKEWKNWVI